MIKPILAFASVVVLLSACGSDSESVAGTPTDSTLDTGSHVDTAIARAYSAEDVMGNWLTNPDSAGRITIAATFNADGSYSLVGSTTSPDGSPLSGSIAGAWNFVAPASVAIQASSCVSDPADNVLIRVVICSQVIDATSGVGVLDTLPVEIDSAGHWKTSWLTNELDLIPQP